MQTNAQHNKLQNTAKYCTTLQTKSKLLKNAKIVFKNANIGFERFTCYDRISMSAKMFCRALRGKTCGRRLFLSGTEREDLRKTDWQAFHVNSGHTRIQQLIEATFGR